MKRDWPCTGTDLLHRLTFWFFFPLTTENEFFVYLVSDPRQARWSSMPGRLFHGHKYGCLPVSCFNIFPLISLIISKNIFDSVDEVVVRCRHVTALFSINSASTWFFCSFEKFQKIWKNEICNNKKSTVTRSSYCRNNWNSIVFNLNMDIADF